MIDTQKPFMCEWAGCMKAFKTPKEVENHAIAVHCPLASSPAPSPSPPPSPSVKIDTQKPFMCEWAGCMKAFKTPKEVENHAIAVHCPLASDDIPCLWARCDGMKRKRFSLMTHLQDRHCHPQLMKLMAVRRVQIAQTG